jgi:hypothetical protein
MRHSLVVVLACLMSARAATQAPPTPQTLFPQDWTSLRRHFSFSGITFDLTYNTWGYGAQIERLADCSTERNFCFSSRTFSVVLPKQCSDLRVGHWAEGDVHTGILYRYRASSPPLHGGGSDTTLYLGTPERPHQLFVYDLNRGLTGLYWDTHERFDFVALAREGRLAHWLISNEDADARRDFYFNRSTFDQVGTCRG